MKRLTILAALLIVAACGKAPEKEAPSASDTSKPLAPVSEPPSPEEAGRLAFRACAICHTVTDPAAPDAQRLVGPSLYRIYGAPSAREAEFAYSNAMRAANITWDDATLDAYIEAPNKVVPGTRMAYVGERDAAKRAALIAYLKTLQ
jgi:cytochrome c